MQVLLMDADSFLELLDVLGATLTEGSLRLAVALLALLRGSVDLGEGSATVEGRNERDSLKWPPW